MALPANTVHTYGIVGIREDLSDMIYDISPTETPFMTRCSKTSADSTLHEWQTDALRAASTANAHLEGDDTAFDAQTPTVRLSNRTQIFKNAVVASGTESAVKKAGRGADMARLVLKTTKEHKLDIEATLFANQAANAGAAGTARRLAGIPSWIKTNASVGATGANPVTIGTTTRTDGTQRAFSQTLLDTVMQSMWAAGGKPETVYLSATSMATAQGFTGNNGQQSTIDAKGKTVVKHMAVYVTPWGTVDFVPHRLMRARDAIIAQDDMWAIATLRATKNEALAKTGDNEKRQVVTELTLVCKNEAASGIVADLS